MPCDFWDFSSSNPCPLQWKWGVLTTGTLGNSLLYSYLYHLNFKIKSKFENGKISIYGQKIALQVKKYLCDWKYTKIHTSFCCLMNRKWLCDDLLLGVTHPLFGVSLEFHSEYGASTGTWSDLHRLPRGLLSWIYQRNIGIWKSALGWECECSIKNVSNTSLVAKGSEPALNLF